MTRLLALVLLVSLGAAPAIAQPNPYVIALTASATPAPTPALKYELLPRLRDRVPGNAALEYHRAYLLRPAWPGDPKEGQALQEKLIGWEEMPLEQLPVADVRNYLRGYTGTFRALDRGARCDHCDWELTGTLKTNHIETLLPEVQATRDMSRFHLLRIKADLAENKFDDVAHGLQTGFRMAKDVGEGPTLIQMLVGLSLGNVYVGASEKLIGRPDAPNLYWAVTTLPRPFIDPRPGLQGEAILFDSLFPDLRELEKGPVSAERANVAAADMFRKLRRIGGGEDDPADDPLGKVELGTYVTLQAPAARKQLIAMGRPAEEVEKMPPAQAVVLRAAAVLRSLSDDQAKCFSLPYPQATKELGAVRERANQLAKDNAGDVFIKLFLLALPATEKVYEAHARLERRLAGLRAVEAVRLYAAAHGGTPPKTLADVPVPVPDDPYTLKPFGYTVDGHTFTLDAPSVNGEPAHAGNSFRYQVTIRGK
jgi:hypothetical protein